MALLYHAPDVQDGNCNRFVVAPVKTVDCSGFLVEPWSPEDDTPTATIPYLGEMLELESMV
jgi:hypothetical protein